MQSEAIQHVQAKTTGTKVLIRIIPGKVAKRRAFMEYVMKAGRFCKASQSQARLLLQRLYSDGSPIYEVCSVSDAYTRIQKENPGVDPKTVLTASSLPKYMEEMQDFSKMAVEKGKTTRDASFESMLSEAHSGDLLMSSSDEQALAEMIQRGETVRQHLDPNSTDARLANMESIIQRMEVASTRDRESLRGAEQRHADPTEAEGVDPYDVPLANPVARTARSPITKSEVRDSDISEVVPSEFVVAPEPASPDPAAVEKEDALERDLLEAEAAEEPAKKKATRKKATKGRRKKVPKLGQRKPSVRQ